MAKAVKGFSQIIDIVTAGEGSLGKAFYQKCGKEALPIIAEVMGQVGMEWSKIIKQNLSAKTIKAYGELQDIFNSEIEGGLETVELTDDKWHIKMSYCPYGLAGAGQELCDAMMTADEKMVSGSLGQTVKLEIMKSIARGDKYCEMVFSIK